MSLGFSYDGKLIASGAEKEVTIVRHIVVCSDSP
jgi:hypothetical protein